MITCGVHRIEYYGEKCPQCAMREPISTAAAGAASTETAEQIADKYFPHMSEGYSYQHHRRMYQREICKAAITEATAQLQIGKNQALQLCRDCLDAAKAQGLQLVKQPLDEHDLITGISEHFEFVNLRAETAERDLAAEKLRNEGLRKNLQKYGQHLPTCKRFTVAYAHEKCDCGLGWALLSAPAPAQAPASEEEKHHVQD